jgi:hypothetical protein
LTLVEAAYIRSRRKSGEKIHGEELERYRLHVKTLANALMTSKGIAFQHFKGKKYFFMNLAIDSETLEVKVIYFPAEGNDDPPWIRDLSSWLEEVESDGIRVPRFESCREIRSRKKAEG